MSSFCIRSISNGGRYVPSLVAANAAQGCGRRFNSRHVKPVAAATTSSSTFLNEFLGINVPQSSSLGVREDYKLSNISREASNNVYPQSKTVKVDYLVKGEGADNYKNGNEVNSRIPAGGNYELLQQDVSRICYTGSVTHQRGLSNDSRFDENISSISITERNQICKNGTTTFAAVDALTKDEAKVRFATVAQSAIAPKPKTGDALSVDETDKDRKPSQEDLERIYQTLIVDLPNLFVKSIDYRIYHPEIEFVNNIKGDTTKGLYNYVKQVSFLRTVGHLKFAYVKFEILKITKHTQDNSIRVRWRINGLSGIKIFMSFWKFKVWSIRESVKEQLKTNETWYDGFSTFYVGPDGLVFRHVADKMMPDDELEESKPKPGIPSKIAPQLTFSRLN